MFLVGGGILTHGLPPVHHGIEQVAALTGMLGGVVSMALDAVVGIDRRHALALAGRDWLLARRANG
jgi:predicted DNA repair protein MutK